MPVLLKCLPIPLCLLLFACGGPGVPDLTDTDPNETDPGPTTGEAVALSGTIQAPTGGASKLRAQAAAQTYMVLAQSNETGEIYRGVTDGSGDFEIEIPAGEVGNSFVVTILGPDGKAVGPVLFGIAEDSGIMGLDVERDVTLGTIELPDDPATDPIEPGEDADCDDLVDADVTTRVNEQGLPVGLDSCGKGAAALDDGDDSEDDAQQIDRDRDGLIDVFDADDDGDGIVDDFEADGDPGGLPLDIHVSFFMNLKVANVDAPVYYTGSAAEIAAALSRHTIITLECMMEPSATREIVSVHALETPGPAYLPTADKAIEDPNTIVFENWAGLDYAFDEAADRFEAFVRPNTPMDAGDTFTIEVAFDDGTTEQYSRMINFVFKNIPRLVRYGAAGALNDYDATSETANGTPDNPIPFDGSQDFVLVFYPPVDETGAYLTDLDYYTFAIFYNSADGRQLNHEMDEDATWTSLPPDFEAGGTYYVDKEDLTLAADNTYTVTLPREIFLDAVTTTSAEEVPVVSYQLDITAETSSGNAAVILNFAKQ